jgi:hypothetical protein
VISWFEVWVCASSDEVSDNFRVEILGVRGIVKRSESALQQKKKKKKENRESGLERVNPK